MHGYIAELLNTARALQNWLHKLHLAI